MSVSSALDVAIGLAFLFFLFSLVISRINEFVATALNLRHKGLENALRAMLNDHRPDAAKAGGDDVVSAGKVLNHALVKPIQQAIQGRFLTSALGKLGLGRTKISYLPSRTFSAAVFDLLARPARRIRPTPPPLRARARPPTRWPGPRLPWKG